MNNTFNERMRHCWDMTDWGSIVQDIAGLPIPFDNNWKSIAVDMSGGADSTFLAYILADHINKIHARNKYVSCRIHIISHVRMWRTRPWQTYYRKRVIDALILRFPRIKFIMHENFVPPEIEMGAIGQSIKVGDDLKSGDQIESGSYARYICKTFKIDAKFGSTTANPLTLHNSGGAPDRDVDYSTVTNLPLQRLVHPISMKPFKNKMPVVFEPFAFLEKDVILSKYKELGIVDLFDLTRSCEGELFDLLEPAREAARQGLMPKPNGDYMLDAVNQYEYGDYVPVCGKCYWCKEREWAINKSKIYE